MYLRIYLLLRNYISLFLLLVSASPVLVKIGIISHYYLRLDKYKNELCENKDKPQMNCNGSCQLNKELASAESTENTPEKPNFPNLPSEELVGAIVENEVEWNCTFAKGNLFRDIYKSGECSGYLGSAYHPPEA